MWDGKQRVTKGLTKQNKTNSVITRGGGWEKLGEGGQIHGVWKLEENQTFGGKYTLEYTDINLYL